MITAIVDVDETGKSVSLRSPLMTNVEGANELDTVTPDGKWLKALVQPGPALREKQCDPSPKKSRSLILQADSQGQNLQDVGKAEAEVRLSLSLC